MQTDQLAKLVEPGALYAYDSTRPEMIPADAAVVLYYADGRYRYTAAQLDRFPHARVRAITVLGDPACNVADVETGDMRPEDAPNHLRAWRQLHPGGEPGTIYCNRSTLPAVQGYVRKAGFKGDEWNVWLATLDGTVPAGISGGGRLVAVQAWRDLHGGWDRSKVLDRSWPRAKPYPLAA